MTDIDLDLWLSQCAASIELPLKRKKMRKRSGDVTLAVEIYRTRFANNFYVEFAIYSDELLRPEANQSKTVPVYDWRLKNPSFRRSDGFCPDLPLTNEDRSALALAKEQIVIQGKGIFEAAHSLQTLVQALRRQRTIDAAWKGNEAVDAHIADRIETFLALKGQGA